MNSHRAIGSRHLDIGKPPHSRAKYACRRNSTRHVPKGHAQASARPGKNSRGPPVCFIPVRLRYRRLLFVVLRLFRRSQAFQALEQLFLGHGVQRRRCRRHRPWSRSAPISGRLGLGLVDFDVFLQRVDQFLLQIAGRDRTVSDFAQGHDRVLVIVAIDR